MKGSSEAVPAPKEQQNLARESVGFAAKRLKTIAQGFNPGLRTSGMHPESGARDCHAASFVLIKPQRQFWCHFQGTSDLTLNLGLKPWAMIFRPFGASP